MISPTERATWFKEQRARFAQPDFDTRVTSGERAFVRTLGMRCPHCSEVFFSYQVEGQERQPYQVDRNPDFGNGMRQTCGSPSCWDKEDLYQFERRKGFREEHARHQQATAAGPAPKKGGKL